jgi:hypothetical protein
MEYLKAHYKNRGDQRKILDPILHERKETILLAQVLALKTVPSEGTEGYEMFEENESAQLILTKFLKHRNYKLNKEHLDVLFDMYLYMETLPTGDEKDQFNKFKNIIPRETEEYKDKKRKQEDKKEKAERKKKEAEFRETQRQEKKQRLLLESQKKAREARQPAADGERDDDDEEVDVTADKYAEFKYGYSSFNTVEYGHNRECGRAGRSSRDDTAKDHTGIIKSLMAVVGNKVKVQYEEPGPFWKSAVRARIHNLNVAFNLLDDVHHGLVEACMADTRNTINRGNGRVLLAIMLHASVKDKKELNAIGLHPNFFEKNFLADLKNTKDQWQPTLTALNVLHGIHYWVCEADDIVGMGPEERFKTLVEALESDNFMQAGKLGKCMKLFTF